MPEFHWLVLVGQLRGTGVHWPNRARRRNAICLCHLAADMIERQATEIERLGGTPPTYNPFPKET